jgi:hypothetical protein
MSYRLTTYIMECRTANVLAYQEVRVLGAGERENLAGGFLRRRALRDTLEASDVAPEYYEGCLRI